MNNFIKQKKHLQRISQVKLNAARRRKLDIEMHYPELLVEPDVWYTHPVIDHHGNKVTMRLLNRPGKRCDSYFIEFQGSQVYFNRFGNMVLNQTRWPLILGFYDSLMFFAKQFTKISGKRVE